jgi:natural product biosynthesis luciferase-like monooxygenase protein
MTTFSSILVGNEALLVQCGQILLERGHTISAVVTRTPSIANWARELSIRVEQPGRNLAARLGQVKVDWLFSIANLALIPEDVLALASSGAINFHDGPLPAYAGLNAPVWALLSGERDHGITWHMITEEIDAGAIVMRQAIKIDDDETAFTLNAKCFAAAIESFVPLVEALEAGSLSTEIQDFSNRTIFSRADRPPAAGRIDFNWTANRLSAFVRALDHGDYLNPLTTPKVDLGGLVASIRTAVREPSGEAAPGTVLEVDSDNVLVAAIEGSVRLSGLTDATGRPIDPTQYTRAGATLHANDDTDSLTAAMAQAAPRENTVRTLLANPVPSDLGLTHPAKGSASVGEIPIVVPAGLDCNRIFGVLAAAALRSTGRDAIDLAYAGNPVPCSAGYFSEWVPLRIAVEGNGTITALTDYADAQIVRARAHPSFALDIVLRDPAIAAAVVPEVGFSEAREPGLISGTAVTLHSSDNGLRLFHDSARIDTDSAKLFAKRIECVAAALNDDADVTLASVPILSDHERELVTRHWNQSEVEYDRDQTMHGAFEEQVGRTPDAVALVFEDQELSYADLDARANQVAHVLRDMGVGRGTFVGLYLTRSLDLVIAAIAVLKAGAAYVPLDPAYPADRTSLYIEDSGAKVIVTSAELAVTLPESAAQSLLIDHDERIGVANIDVPKRAAAGHDAAYLIYTSGSTGRPKGVVLEHRNVMNFFRGMDDRIAHEPAATWLAVTSLNFDISVLELFYTLARGFKVVIVSEEARLTPSDGVARSEKGMQFSLFYWGNDDGVGPKKYELLLEGAKIADANGFCAVWTPERHFHAFGGPYPNPSVTGAAVAAVTKRIGVRAGSCVAPLHHTARIAEEWAVIDNLTNGRAGLAIASGWQPDDFLLRPENAPPNNKPAMLDAIETLRKLWRGEPVAFDRPLGGTIDVVTQPRPVSKDLPIWVTTAGNPDTWKEAGRIGANVLTHLLGQNIEEVAEKIGIYHTALKEAGYDPAAFTVTLMLHTYIANSRDSARETAREPMKNYLRSAAGLIKQYAWAFPAFKKPQGVSNPMQIDLDGMDEEEMEAILDFAFRRYFEDSGLFGTVEDAVRRVEELKAIGINEIACLIDYGISVPQVIDGLNPLAEVLRRTNLDIELDDEDFSIAAQICRHKVTHFQCTPSMARLLLADPGARAALSRVEHIMIGGEALPGRLARELADIVGRPIQNMYGPTETTIWSSTELTTGDEGTVNIGRPIANTQFYVLDADEQPQPVGVPGELFIGGDGVAREYWKRPDLTAERFRPDPFVSRPGARMYRTGDLAKWRPDGRVHYLGRADNQLKIRGYRIELGEIEAVLEEQPTIRQAVVVAREDTPADVRLVAYLLSDATISPVALRTALAAKLPDFMVPAHYVQVDAFPLTPNKKVDRKALPEPIEAAPANQVAKAPPIIAAPADAPTPPGNVEEQIAAVWRRVLGVSQITPKDNFFSLGGHSLLAVQVHRELKAIFGPAKLSITDIFRFPTLGALSQHLAPDQPVSGVRNADPGVQETANTASLGRGQMRRDAMSRRREMRARRQESA